MRLLHAAGGGGKNVHFIFIPFGKFRNTNFNAIFYMVVPGSDVSARSFLVPGREVLDQLASRVVSGQFGCCDWLKQVD